jgi:hypothetical protein
MQTLSDAQRTRWSTDGYLHLEGVLSAQEVDFSVRSSTVSVHSQGTSHRTCHAATMVGYRTPRI